MSQKQQSQLYRKRFYLTVFVYLPISLIVGFCIGITISVLVFDIGFVGIILVGIGLIPLYIMGVMIVYFKYRKDLKSIRDDNNFGV